MISIGQFFRAGDGRYLNAEKVINCSFYEGGYDEDEEEDLPPRITILMDSGHHITLTGEEAEATLERFKRAAKLEFGKPKCHRCGREYMDMVILKDPLWEKIAKFRREHMCFKCMDRAFKANMGRPIFVKDLKPEAGITEIVKAGARMGQREAKASRRR